MKRLFIIVEGQSEQEFINTIIRPYLQSFNIYDVSAKLIKTSKDARGGFVNYQHLKNDIIGLLKQSEDIIVTSFVDFFKIPTNMPSYDLALSKPLKINQVTTLEEAFQQNIEDPRFIPYIQLHEFEALLFSSNKGFDALFDENDHLIFKLDGHYLF